MATKKASKKSTNKAVKKSRTKKSTRKKYGSSAAKQVKTEMHEMKKGKLKSGRSGKKVTSRKQAIAIGLSEARKKGAKVPKKKMMENRTIGTPRLRNVEPHRPEYRSLRESARSPLALCLAMRRLRRTMFILYGLSQKKEFHCSQR